MAEPLVDQHLPAGSQRGANIQHQRRPHLPLQLLLRVEQSTGGETGARRERPARELPHGSHPPGPRHLRTRGGELLEHHLGLPAARRLAKLDRPLHSELRVRAERLHGAPSIRSDTPEIPREGRQGVLRH